MAPSELSPFSLPLRFQLLPSLAHPTTPCACLTVQLPLRLPGAPPYQPNQPSFTVTRILDPEHKEPFISLGPILLASGLTPLEGLLLFGLRTPAYDLNLGGIAPFRDLWIPLKLARTCATRLSRLDELAGLLEWRSRSAWTVEDKEEGGLVSNWKVGSDRVDPAEYSTAAMLATAFPRVHLLPGGTQVRTFVPPELADAGSGSGAGAAPLLAGGFEDLHRRVVEWTAHEWEDWLESEEEGDTSQVAEPGMHEQGRDLTTASFFSAGLSLLSLIDGLPPEALSPAPPGSSVRIAPADRFPAVDSSTLSSATAGSESLRVASPPLGLVELPVELELTRHELLTGSGKARLALVDFLARLVAREWTRSLEAELVTTSRRGPDPGAEQSRPVTVAKGVSFDDFAALLARVEALESAGVATAREHEPNPATRSAEKGRDHYDELERENARLRRQLREAKEAGPANAEVRNAPELVIRLPLLAGLAVAVVLLWRWKGGGGIW